MSDSLVAGHIEKVDALGNRMTVQSPSGVASGLSALAHAIAALALVLAEKASVE